MDSNLQISTRMTNQISLIIEKNPKTGVVKDILSNVHKAHVACAKVLQVKMPLENKLLQYCVRVHRMHCHSC